LRELYSFRCKLIEIGRLDDFVAVACEVTPAHVIDEKNDDVRFFGRSDSKKKKYCEDNSEFHGS
jgi:hypothetical protein